MGYEFLCDLSAFFFCLYFVDFVVFLIAVKCNDSPVVLALLAQLGSGFDCASKVSGFCATADMLMIWLICQMVFSVHAYKIVPEHFRNILPGITQYFTNYFRKEGGGIVICLSTRKDVDIFR